MRITLSSEDLTWASSVGAARHISAIRRGLKDKHGLMADTAWQVHIEGACGELAAAKALGVPWSATVDTFKRGDDVPGGWQIRTRSRPEYELIVRPGDPDDALFLLVLGVAPHYVVKGWITGREAKRPEWSRAHGNRPPAYFVPHDQLTPLSAG